MIVLGKPHVKEATNMVTGRAEKWPRPASEAAFEFDFLFVDHSDRLIYAWSGHRLEDGDRVRLIAERCGSKWIAVDGRTGFFVECSANMVGCCARVSPSRSRGGQVCQVGNEQPTT